MSLSTRKKNKIGILKDNKLKYRIPTCTFRWTEKDIEYFNVKITSLEVPNYLKDDLPVIFRELILEGWDEETIKFRNLEDLNKIAYDVIEALNYTVLLSDKIDFDEDIKANSFINQLMNNLGFFGDQYDLYLNPNISFQLDDKSYDTTVDFLITKDDEIIILLDENNILKFGSNDWGEYQIIGEIIMFTYYHAMKKHSFKSIKIHVIKYLDSQFTFYSSELSKEYILNSLKTNPKDELLIKRCPYDSKKHASFNFCDEGDRFIILKIIYSLYSSSF